MRHFTQAAPPATGWQRYRKIALTEAQRIDEPFEVATLEGVMTAKAGDYLMRGAQGELYSCDAGIFEQAYQPAHEDIASEGGW